MPNGSSSNWSGFKFIFAPTDPSSGNANKEYLFGSTVGSVSMDDISFGQEVVGIYLLPNGSPDFEGLFFLLQDKTTILRIG